CIFFLFYGSSLILFWKVGNSDANTLKTKLSKVCTAFQPGGISSTEKHTLIIIDEFIKILRTKYDITSHTEVILAKVGNRKVSLTSFPYENLKILSFLQGPVEYVIKHNSLNKILFTIEAKYDLQTNTTNYKRQWYVFSFFCHIEIFLNNNNW